MEARSLEFVAAACEGELLFGSPDALVRRVCTDSRQIAAGDLFIALAGEKFDAHSFLAEVVEVRAHGSRGRRNWIWLARRATQAQHAENRKRRDARLKHRRERR